MAKTKKKKAHAFAGYGLMKHKSNTGKKHGGGGHAHRAMKKNAPSRARGRGIRGFGDYAVNGIFVVAGALGTKLLTQMLLGANNTGIMGYGANALSGAVLWFITDKTLHNPAASSGIISGTVVQLIIRLINDYTPFGQYISQLGMGDYQAQAFLTPQVLVDPVNSTQIRWPAGLLAAMAASAPPATTMPAQAGVSGFDPLYGNRSDLY